jgi:hypothetical protein
MSEATPLLVDEGDNAPDIEHVPASTQFRGIIKSLTVVILVVSVTAILILIANFIIITNGPFKWEHIERAAVWTAQLGIYVRIRLPSTFSTSRLIQDQTD